MTMENRLVFLELMRRHLTLDEAERLAVLGYRMGSTFHFSEFTDMAKELMALYSIARMRQAQSVAHIDTAHGPIRIKK